MPLLLRLREVIASRAVAADGVVDEGALGEFESEQVWVESGAGEGGGCWFE